VVQGQIAHLDRNNENNDPDNLVFLCLSCHDLYDSKNSQSKGFIPQEVKNYRGRLYKEIEKLRSSGNLSIDDLNPDNDSDEIIIIIANFHEQSIRSSFDVAGRIKNALATDLARYNLPNVRLVQVNRSFRLGEDDSARKFGKDNKATLIIWGHYDDFGVFPHFTVTQDKYLTILPEGPQEKLVSLASPPDDFIFYINRHLPNQFNYFTQFTIGQIFYQKRYFNEAQILFESSVKLAEEFESKEIQDSLALAYFYKAMTYIEIKTNLKKATEDFTKVIELKPNFSEAYTNRGGIYLYLNDLEHAIESFSQAIKVNPVEYVAYNNRAVAYASIDKFDQALSDFNESIKANPQSPIAHYNLGNIFKDSGSYTKAIECFRLAIKADPNFPETYFGLGILYRRLGDYKQAIDNYTIAITLDPKHAKAYNNRGIVYNSLGDYKQAVLDFNKAIELDPKDSMSFYNRGISFTHLDDFDLALVDFSKAIELTPNLAVAYNNRGNTYGRLDKIEQGIDDFTMALELNPNFADAYRNRGISYYHLRMLEKAISDFKEYVKLESDLLNRQEVWEWIINISEEIKESRFE
jgi:tetratricopeptide (TPR) repeat protein